MVELARRSGLSEGTVTELAWDRRGHTSTAIVEAVRALYEELKAVPGGSTGARNLAGRNGWPPPPAWDPAALDDPAYQPGDSQNRRCPTCGGRLTTAPEPSGPY